MLTCIQIKDPPLISSSRKGVIGEYLEVLNLYFENDDTQWQQQETYAKFV